MLVELCIDGLKQLTERSIASIDPAFTALIEAGDIKVIKEAVSRVFQDGKNILHLLIQSLNWKYFKIIIELQLIDLNVGDDYSRTPLMYCCIMDPVHPEDTKVLHRMFLSLLNGYFVRRKFGRNVKKRIQLNKADIYDLNALHMCLVTKKLVFSNELLHRNTKIKSPELGIPDMQGLSFMHFVANISTRGPSSNTDKNLVTENVEISEVMDRIVSQSIQKTTPVSSRMKGESVLYSAVYTRNLVLFNTLMKLDEQTTRTYWEVEDIVMGGCSPVFASVLDGSETIEDVPEERSDAWFCERLIDAGADFDQEYEDYNKLTPLHVAVQTRRPNMDRYASRELIWLLVERGADINHSTVGYNDAFEPEVSTLFADSLFAGEAALIRRILDSTSLDHQRNEVGASEGSFLSDVFALHCHFSEEVFDLEWAIRYIEVIKLLLERGEPAEYLMDDSDVHYFSILSDGLFFRLHDEPKSRYFVLKAVNAIVRSKKVDVNFTRGQALNFLMTSLHKNCYSLVRLFVEEGINIDYAFKSIPCSKRFQTERGPHRFVGYENLEEFLLSQGKSLEGHNFVCDVCLDEMDMRNTKAKVCDEYKCDTLACERCFTYQQDSSEHPLVTLAKRRADPVTVNYILGVVSPVGRKLQDIDCFVDQDIFFHAKLMTPDLIRRLSKNQLWQLGLEANPEQIVQGFL